MTCPNKSHPDWIELVNKIGESNAFVEYTRNGLEIPDPTNYEIQENRTGRALDSLFPGLVVKEGVSEVFNENPELASIGTQEQYSQYLGNIFPDSKVQDIVYHGTDIDNIEVFNPNKGTGSSFATDINYAKQYGKNIVSALVDLKNPETSKGTPILKKALMDVSKTLDQSLRDNNLDGVFTEETIGGLSKEAIVTRPEQIHILGSKQDIEGFREFVKTATPAPIQYVTNEETAEWEQERQTRIKQSVKNFLEANGISYEAVSNLTDSNGNALPANAIADMAAKAVRVLQGYESVEILGEEAAHFLVELLGEDSPLFQSMMSEIDKYEIYQEVISRYGNLPGYKGNIKKLKKEAIGQLIGKMLAGSFEDSSKQERAGRWWNRVLRFLKEKVNSLVGREVFENAVVEYNPFSEAADIILSERNLTDESTAIAEGIYYSTNVGEQNRIVNDVKNKHQISSLPNHEGYERVVEGQKVKVKNRVTDRVSNANKKRFTTPRTAEEKVIDDIKKKYGTTGHGDIQNIILRLIAERAGTVLPSREHALPDDMYNTLEKHFTKFIKGLPADSIILPEVTLYDSKSDEAGTLDLLVIHSDGSVSIYDWKFIDFKNKKEIAFYKRQGWEIQLPRYREILRAEYGVTKFKQIRVIPISAIYKGGDLKSIQVGDADIKSVPEDQSHLLPVPMSEEMTGVESLDRLLQSLLREKTEWENKRPSRSLTPEEVDAFRANRTIELRRIEKAMGDIQRDHDITEYVERGLDLIRTLASTDIQSMSLEELLNLVEIKLKRYGHEMIGLSKDLGEDVLTKELKEKLTTLTVNAQSFESNFLPEIGARIAQLAGETAMDARVEKSWWGRNVLTISRQDDPIIQSFWDLVKRSKEKTRQALRVVRDEIREAIDGLVAENPNAGANLYNFMIKEKANGELATVDKFSQEFYKKLTEQREILKSSGHTKQQKATAAKWIRENTEFNEESYKRGLETFTAFLNRAYKEYGNKDQLIYERTEDYKNRYGNNNQGLSNDLNRNIKIKDNPANYSNEFKIIASSPAKTKFYNLWMERNREFIEYTGVNRRASFIWNIPKNLVQRVAEGGLSSLVDAESAREQFLMREGDTLGMINPDTNKLELNIPVYYNTLNTRTDAEGNIVVNNRNQSRNLGEVLLQAGSMAYNHKHLSEIEANSQLLRYAMSTRETLHRGTDGGVLRNKLTGALDKAFKSSNDLEQFEDYLNHYVYGRTLKSTDREIKGKDRIYSRNAIILYIQRWFTAKALAFNPVSITANAIGGNYMAIMTGASGRLFNNKDYNKAVSWDLPMKDATSYSLIGLADLLDRDDFKRLARKTASYSLLTKELITASYNFLTKELTYDNLFIGQRGGDWWIRNATLVAMSKKYKVEEGQIKRVGNEESTSLYDYIKNNTKEGKVNLEGLKQGELEKFIEAVQHTTETILGNSSRDDINTLRLTIAGRALTMFRSWIPATYEARFGDLKYNAELDMHNKGRYMTFFETVWNKKVMELGWGMIKSFGLIGFGGTVGNATKAHAERLWQIEMDKNPNINMTKEEYLEMHIGNLRSMMAEIYIYASIVGMLMLLRGDDDETLEQGSLRKYAYEQLDRVKLEVATFWHPAEFYKMMRSPIPMVGLWNDLDKIGYAMFGVPYKAVTGKTEEINPTRARRALTSNVPILSGIEKIWYFMDEDYDKAIKQLKD